MFQIVPLDVGPICGEIGVGTDLGEKSKASTPPPAAPWACSLSSTALSACLPTTHGTEKQIKPTEALTGRGGSTA